MLKAILTTLILTSSVNTKVFCPASFEKCNYQSIYFEKTDAGVPPCWTFSTELSGWSCDYYQNGQCAKTAIDIVICGKPVKPKVYVPCPKRQDVCMFNDVVTNVYDEGAPNCWKPNYPTWECTPRERCLDDEVLLSTCLEPEVKVVKPSVELKKDAEEGLDLNQVLDDEFHAGTKPGTKKKQIDKSKCPKIDAVCYVGNKEYSINDQNIPRCWRYEFPVYTCEDVNYETKQCKEEFLDVGGCFNTQETDLFGVTKEMECPSEDDICSFRGDIYSFLGDELPLCWQPGNPVWRCRPTLDNKCGEGSVDVRTCFKDHKLKESALLSADVLENQFKCPNIYEICSEGEVQHVITKKLTARCWGKTRSGWQCKAASDVYSNCPDSLIDVDHCFPHLGIRPIKKVDKPVAVPCPEPSDKCDEGTTEFSLFSALAPRCWIKSGFGWRCGPLPSDTNKCSIKAVDIINCRNTTTIDIKDSLGRVELKYLFGQAQSRSNQSPCPKVDEVCNYKGEYYGFDVSSPPCWANDGDSWSCQPRLTNECSPKTIDILGCKAGVNSKLHQSLQCPKPGEQCLNKGKLIEMNSDNAPKCWYKNGLAWICTEKAPQVKGCPLGKVDVSTCSKEVPKCPTDDDRCAYRSKMYRLGQKEAKCWKYQQNSWVCEPAYNGACSEGYIEGETCDNRAQLPDYLCPNETDVCFYKNVAYPHDTKDTPECWKFVKSRWECSYLNQVSRGCPDDYIPMSRCPKRTPKAQRPPNLSQCPKVDEVCFNNGKTLKFPNGVKDAPCWSKRNDTWDCQPHAYMSDLCPLGYLNAGMCPEDNFVLPIPGYKCPEPDALGYDGENFHNPKLNSNLQCWSKVANKWLVEPYYDVTKRCNQGFVDLSRCYRPLPLPPKPPKYCPETKETCTFGEKSYTPLSSSAPLCWLKGNGSRSKGYSCQSPDEESGLCPSGSIYIDTCRPKVWPTCPSFDSKCKDDRDTSYSLYQKDVPNCWIEKGKDSYQCTRSFVCKKPAVDVRNCPKPFKLDGKSEPVIECPVKNEFCKADKEKKQIRAYKDGYDCWAKAPTTAYESKAKSVSWVCKKPGFANFCPLGFTNIRAEKCKAYAPRGFLFF